MAQLYTNPIEPWLVDEHKAAWMLGCNRKQVKQYLDDGTLRAKWLGPRSLRITVSSIKALLQKRQDEEDDRLYGVPIVNEPPVYSSPVNCIIRLDAAPPKMRPVRLMPYKRFYTYVLRRPDGRAFYVGKGHGRRAEQHITEARKGTCHCRKCRIIQGIERVGKEVDIDYAFHTDNEKEARECEKELIRELGHLFNLCNQQDNFGLWSYRALHPGMTRAEADALLDEIDLPPRERTSRLMEWARERRILLEDEWRIARLHKKDEEAEILRQEIETLRMMRGDVYQHEIPFERETKQRVNRIKKHRRNS
jgi:hypothetical protein